MKCHAREKDEDHNWSFFFFNDTATTEIYTLSLHDALPICDDEGQRLVAGQLERPLDAGRLDHGDGVALEGEVDEVARPVARRSEEHTSELQSRQYLVCRLLLEKKKRRSRTLSALHAPPRAS